MKPYCFILCLGWCSLTLFSQPVTTLKTASRAAQKAYEDGVRHYQSNQYEKAGQSFRKALEKSPRFIDAAVQLASVCFDQEDHACAIQFFEQALQWDSTYQRKIYYTLALSQYRSDHFNAAAKNMKRFLSLETSNADLISKASQLLPNLIFADSAVRHPVPVQPDFIEPLNSDFSEYLPSLTADGKTAVFTRRSPNRDEDLYMSRQVDGKWTEAFPISALNTPLNEGSPAIAPDGLSLVFTSCDRKSSYGGCDLYQSHWKDNAWTEPYNLGDKINTPAYESQACFADNGKVLYFASNRKGSYGGFDLWYCFRKPDRSWSIPKNLGPVINSAGNEDCPFIHPNGAFLFYSSDAPPGMGGKDLFYSERNHETGQWGSPVNLGYPINSKGDESSFVVFPDGKTAWMASDQKYFQTATAQRKFNLDLYELKLPASLQIKPSTSVTIRILDRATDLPVQADVHIYDLSNDSTYHKSKAGPSGYLLISLTTGADYGLQVVHPKYVFVSDQFRCSEVKSQYDPMELMIYLDRVDSIPATAHILKNIFFESGSAVLRQESFFELDGMVRFLQDQARLRLKITGHTDHIGSEGDNEILSLKRAQAVIQYLTSKGINASRLLGEGKGESEPLASNETEAGRQMNRRIEFTIIQP